MTTQMATKRCSSCREIKPIDEFAWRNMAKGQHEPTCRDCKSQQFRRWRTDPRNHLAARDASEAKNRARQRLIERYPHVYRRYLDEERENLGLPVSRRSRNGAR
jgi:NAD-dependent SIR2 family protein deacetylase